MTKKKLPIIFTILLIMLSNAIVYADVPVEQYNLEKLKQMYINESFEVKMIDLETKLLQTQHNDNINKYKDFKKVVSSFEDTMKMNKAIREESLLLAKMSYNPDTVGSAVETAKIALSQYVFAKNQYKTRVKEDVQMMQNLEPVIFQISIAEAKKQGSIAKSEYELERDYYNLVTLHRELDLLNKDLENLVRKLKIDDTREKMGMITALEKEETEKQIRELEKNKRTLENNLELSIKMLETKLKLDVIEDINIVYEAPKTISTKAYILRDVTSKLKENNLDLAAVKNNVDLREEILNKLTVAYDEVEGYTEIPVFLDQYESEQNQIKVAEVEFEKAKIQQYSLERNLELYANNTYYEYKATQDALLSNVLYNNNLYSSKMNIIEINYKQGLISQMEYEFQKQQLNRELNKLEQDKINYVNAQKKMDLMVKGIMVSNTTSM